MFVCDCAMETRLRCVEQRSVRTDKGQTTASGEVVRTRGDVAESVVVRENANRHSGDKDAQEFRAVL